MFQNGIDEILLTTTNVTTTKIRRAMKLREQCQGFIQATDSADNARLLSEAALSMNIVADVVVDVDPGGNRTGIKAGQPALQLAQLVDQLPGLTLRGLLCYDGGSQHVKGFDQRKAQTLGRLNAASETYDLFNNSGLTQKFSVVVELELITLIMKPVVSRIFRSVVMCSWTLNTLILEANQTMRFIQISNQR